VQGISAFGTLHIVRRSQSKFIYLHWYFYGLYDSISLCLICTIFQQKDSSCKYGGVECTAGTVFLGEVLVVPEKMKKSN
jgi:hypothetical protein